MGNNITDLVEFLEPTEEEPEINEETGEVITPEEPEDETDKPTETPEATPAEDETPKEDDEPTDEDTPAEDETATPPKKELTLEEQNAELRQIMRQQSKDLKILKSKLDRIEKRGTKKEGEETLEDLLEYKDPPAEELSDIEVAQAQLAEIAQARGPSLDMLVETMEMNPKYEDVREVCSQNNFADIFAAVGESIAEKEGADPTLAAMEAEVAVWKMPNPYKYMYEIIKKFHPSYTETETKPAAKKPAAKKLPEKAPASIANVPGENVPANKWTAARIDEMPEEDLHEVPEDIYDKYLAGDLD